MREYDSPLASFLFKLYHSLIFLLFFTTLVVCLAQTIQFRKKNRNLNIIFEAQSIDTYNRYPTHFFSIFVDNLTYQVSTV